MLIFTSGATGAMAGGVAGVLWSMTGLTAPSGLATVLVVGALLADIPYTVAGRPAPWSVRSQVPMEWSRLFDPRTAAALYGARLGVGPLTILRSWLWWAAFVIGAFAGPLPSALVGLTFGSMRMVTVVAAGFAVQRSMAERMAHLRRLERFALPATAALIALALIFAHLNPRFAFKTGAKLFRTGWDGLPSSWQRTLPQRQLLQGIGVRAQVEILRTSRKRSRCLVWQSV